MSKILPEILVSSVVRGAQQGDSHGGLYRVDLERGTHELLLDWNDCSINFEGRGADRGLRGIAIADKLTYVAASDELFAFDRNFKIVASWRNSYLKHCHEISLSRGKLYLASTGFDSILRFDLIEQRFDFGMRIANEAGCWMARSFDPAGVGPAPSIELHLNSVYADEFGVFVSGLKLPALLQITAKAVGVVAELPHGTHNARPYKGGVLLNDTDENKVVWFGRERHVSIPVPTYPAEALEHADVDSSGVARQAFGRGLCPLSDFLVAGGSSPTTVSVYDLRTGARMKSINLTMDVRNAAHGMAIWSN